MDLALVKPGEVIAVLSSESVEHLARNSTTLLRTDSLELLRLDLPQGETTNTHMAPGDTVIHCLTGRAELVVAGWPSELRTGELICLTAGQRHSIHAAEATSLLLTIATFAEAESNVVEFDLVQEASEESFPASDPPARSPITGP